MLSGSVILFREGVQEGRKFVHRWIQGRHPLYLDRDEARIMQEGGGGRVGKVFVSNAPMRIASPDISQSLYGSRASKGECLVGSSSSRFLLPLSMCVQVVGARWYWSRLDRTSIAR